MLLSLLALAIYLPLQARDAWVNGPIPLVPATLMPVMLVGLTIADSFAGERERHTLPTLLASRLSDRAILIGKIVPSVGLGWAASLLVLVVGLGIANLANSDSPVVIYSPLVLIAAVSLGFLTAAFVAVVGVLISLHSATVQEASQLLMFAFLLPPPFWRRS